MRFVNNLVFSALAAALMACSPIVDQRGHVFEPDWKERLIPGVTSREEAERVMGSPSSVSSFGAETWYYIATRKETTAFLKPEVVAQEVVKLEFSENGVLSSVETMDEAQARKDFAYVGRTTPTEGHSLTFFEQMLGNIGRFNNPGGVAGAQRNRPGY